MFAAKFNDALRLADKPLDENFEGPRSQYPVTFGPLPAKLYHWPEPPTAAQTVQMKSIRQPKFQIEYTVSLSESVYSLKERLLTDPNCPISHPEYSPQSIKLLLKSKVISDTRQLFELPSLSFTVMLVAAKPQLDVPLSSQIYSDPSKVLASSDIERPEMATQINSQEENYSNRKHVYPGVTDQFWKDVEAIARNYVEDSEELVSALKSGYSASSH